MSTLSILRMAAIGGAGVLILVGVSSCSSDDGTREPQPGPSTTPAASTTPLPAASTPEPPFVELRIAYINLMSPIAVDANNPVAAETFEERLAIVVEELRQLNADIIGFSESAWSKELGVSAASRLARDLKMELQFVRANPWFPGQAKEESDEIARRIGFEEGELILSRYPILGAERLALNPRTSETEVRAVLHAVVKLPQPAGKIDVYIAHLTGGGARVRDAQAESLLAHVRETRSTIFAFVLGDFSEEPDSPVAGRFAAAGFVDQAAKVAQPPALATCCRDAILAEQPPLASRSDYIFADRLQAATVRVFGEKPRKRADGMLLYGSDHNGLVAAFPISAGP